MIRLIAFFVVVALLAWVAVWFADNPGEVTISWLGTTYQSQMGILVLAVLAVAIVLTLAVEILRWLALLPRRIRHARERSRHEKGYRALSYGLVAAAAGDVSTARSNANQAQKLIESPATLLLAAQTAQLEGKDDLAHEKFLQMLKHPATEFLGLRGLLGQAVRDGDRGEALQLAKRAYLKQPRTPWVLETLFDLQLQEGLWKDGLQTVEEMARYHQIPPQTVARRRAILMTMNARELRDAGKAHEARRLARKAFDLAPGFVPNAVLLTELLYEEGKTRLARKTVERAWRRSPHPDLLTAYEKLAPGESAEARLGRVKKLCQQNPNDPQSAMALAEANMAARKFADAEHEIDRAIDLGPTVGTFRLRAALEQARGGSAEKARQWRERAAGARPDFAWVCQTTGAAQPSWTPFGPAGDFDSLVWTTPSPLERILPGDMPSGMRELTATATPAETASHHAQPVGATILSPTKPSGAARPNGAAGATDTTATKRPAAEPAPTAAAVGAAVAARASTPKPAAGNGQAAEAKPASGAKPAASKPATESKPLAFDPKPKHQGPVIPVPAGAKSIHPPARP
ncbi:heme biosynthesis protein HemY [Marinivivus vitaminiproducens]|uniref:heme biosynthesis protein HemY n=1 Tax=Marinivivus vitaminiproducens TaxID=3035935 RepID=UPI0027AA77BD|nr:heme biosynthesis HemY N-terminal domain-containing protein [Geminicoccaceae bacterium SCSIO 64248]